MPRESEFYRQNLEQVLEFTKGKQMLSLSDVRGFTGIRDNRTLKKRFPFCHNSISAATFAACLSQVK